MSSTLATKVDSLVGWLNNNSHWREDLIIKESQYGGLGVFYSEQPEEEFDPLLLRIPKTNLLAPKNSFIYNLLEEYEPINPELVISEGVYALVVSFIYEHSIEHNSPWFEYIESMDIKSSEIPICLWDEADKANLANTEVDLLNMLDPKELIDFYIEVLHFADVNKTFVVIPQVLDVPTEHFSHVNILEKHRDKLVLFGKFLQTTISRAFEVDNYYGLALVPAADIFNHIEPELVNGKVKGREDIHFVWDESVCGICGESACDHEDSDDEDIENNDMEEDMEHENGDVEDSSAGEGELSSEESAEDDSDNEEGHLAHSEEHEELEFEEEEEEEEQEEPIKELTMEHIYELEEELFNEVDTDLDPEEVSTISDEEIQVDNGRMADLAQELSDASKCCDVVLVRRPEASTELFNSYGNELSNAYLLQKYGFISKENVNDNCILSVQFFKQVKSLKEKLNTEKRREIEEKIEWLEKLGYDLINQILAGEHDREHEHEHGHDHDHDDECENDCQDDCCQPQEFPKSWPLSIRINFNGECTPQTYAILKLLELKYVHFRYKLSSTTKERKLIPRIKKLLLTHSPQELATYNKRVSAWCQARIDRYPVLTLSKHEQLIDSMKSQEIRILQKFIHSS